MHWYVLQILSTKVFYTSLCRLHLVNLTTVEKSSCYKRNNSYKNTFSLHPYNWMNKISNSMKNEKIFAHAFFEAIQNITLKIALHKNIP